MALVQMTLEDAKAFFQKYDGHGFHMYREEQGRYEVYRRLQIPKETEEAWRAELREGLAKELAETADQEKAEWLRRRIERIDER